MTEASNFGYLTPCNQMTLQSFTFSLQWIYDSARCGMRHRISSFSLWTRAAISSHSILLWWCWWWWCWCWSRWWQNKQKWMCHIFNSPYALWALIGNRYMDLGIEKWYFFLIRFKYIYDAAYRLRRGARTHKKHSLLLDICLADL